MKKTLIFIAAFIFILSSEAFAITAYDIIKKSEDILRGDSSQGKMVMIITTPKWERKLVMNVWEKGKKKFFVRIVAPAKEAGIGSLKIDDNMWNYLPNVEKVMKIPPSLMHQSWFGSDFTNDDVVKESSIVNDYTHTLLGEESINGVISYKIELLPKPDAPVIWGKIISYVDKNKYLPVKQEFYNEKQKLIRVMNFSDVKLMHDREIPTKMEMLPLNKQGNKTVLIYKELKFNVPISDDIFSLRNLKEVK